MRKEFQSLRVALIEWMVCLLLQLPPLTAKGLNPRWQPRVQVPYLYSWPTKGGLRQHSAWFALHCGWVAEKSDGGSSHVLVQAWLRTQLGHSSMPPSNTANSWSRAHPIKWFKSWNQKLIQSVYSEGLQVERTQQKVGWVFSARPEKKYASTMINAIASQLSRRGLKARE